MALQRGLTPPSKPPPLDPKIKDNVHQCPTAVVDSGRRRHIIRTHEDEWPVGQSKPISSLPIGFLPVFPGNPCDHWHQGANPEKVQEATVDFANAVDACGTDCSPNNRRGEDGSSTRAGEAVALLGGADVFDVAEHPECHSDLG